MLVVSDVTVAFGGQAVLDGVDLAVGDGEIVALLGPSGSGKSTLLRVIAGLLAPDGGRVHLDGRDVTAVPTHRRGVGMVFQDEQLFPHRDVGGNVTFGLTMLPEAARPSTQEQATRVAELLDVVGLHGFERRAVADLSGGEAKRVALARSLAPAPRVLLLDEPLTGLDRGLHDRLAGELRRILQATTTTSLLVTHDAAEAEAVADRVVSMEDLGRSSIEIVELRTQETHPLRAAVLRAGTPSSDVHFASDEDPGTIHLGVRRSGEVVAISTWTPNPFPGDGRPAVQLRGMAVDPRLRGRGVGGRLVEVGVERAFHLDGVELVWANARDAALDFYRRHGFVVVGEGFVTEDTAIPHHRIQRFSLPAISEHPGG